MMAVGLVVLALLSGIVQCLGEDAPIAESRQGRLRGFWAASRSRRWYMAFAGIPYAKPPVGRLRFQPPAPPEPWKGTRLATVDGPYCIQLDLFEIKPFPTGVEDCLYLTLYTHNLTRQAPVLVHFHGGGFVGGNGARKTGPQYFMDEDIVLVDVNYRVGIYGFLSFEDEALPGNQGLKDQVMALKWVQENIACFGGDPNQITIIGESSGGASVFHHIISPLSKGLFHRAITESGTSYNSWAVAPPGYVRNQSIRLLSYIGCEYYNTEDALSCLCNRDPLDVVSKLELFRVWQIDPLVVIGPVFEEDVPGAFLIGPKKKWKHSPVPVLMGATSAEGLLRTLYFPRYNMNYKWYSDNFAVVAPLSLGYHISAKDQEEITEAVRYYYFPNKEITRNDWLNLTTMYSDALFLKGILDGANKHPGKVYMYYFDYVGEKSFAGNSSSRNDSIVFGAYHADDVIYLWDQYDHECLDGKDLRLSQDLIKLWTNFVKYGSPTPRGIQWDEWTPARNRYLHISDAGMKMQEGLANGRYQFWNIIEKMIGSSSLDEYLKLIYKFK